MMMYWGHAFPWICLVLVVGINSQGYNVGRGIADITGMASEAALYGYARPTQTAQGLHLRQSSRAFVFHDGVKRTAFVVAEVTMISQAVHKQVMEELFLKFGNMYTEENVMLSPTHSHSAPGGYHTYWMYQIVTGGFVNETFDVLVDGIVLSIERAHNDIQPGFLFINDGELIDASISRSAYAYDQNPPEERAKYLHNTDKTMTVLKMTNAAQEDMGLVSFYAVHTTSMKNTNHLVSSDNKGYASLMMERALNPGTRPGKGSILAAFTQTSEGDASPNTDGERCEADYSICSYEFSTCPENNLDPRLCTGRGPANEEFEDTRLIGERQFLMTQTLHGSAVEAVVGPIDYRMQWVNMSAQVVTDPDNSQKTTCRPGMGYSFAAGASDGPGIPPFTQGILEPFEALANLSILLFNMTEEYIQCHAPKPVLLASGTVQFPWEWQPEIVPIQLLRIGSLVLIGVPQETTTMSGRRIQDAVKNVLIANGVSDVGLRTIVISMANSFASYLTTIEEFQVQRYEGASTTYGPRALQAYTQLYEGMAAAMATGAVVPRGTPPPDLRGVPNDALGSIKFDETPEDLTYGDIIVDTDLTYFTGDTASVIFVAGNPRHNLMTDATFLEVQLDNGIDWTVMYTDADWETIFYWDSSCDEGLSHPNCTLASRLSNATITWDIPASTIPGTYRLVHYGYARLETGEVIPYVGTSGEFRVEAATYARNTRRMSRIPPRNERSDGVYDDFLRIYA